MSLLIHQTEYNKALVNPPFCKCGCGEVIEIINAHRYTGVPKFRKNHYSKTEEAKKINAEKHIGKISIMKGKTYEELHGVEKATELKIKISTHTICAMQNIDMKGVPKSEYHKNKLSDARKGRTWENVFGVEKACEMKKRVKDKTFEEIYGEEKAKEIKQKLKVARLKHILPLKDTKIEIILQEILVKEGIIFEKHKSLLGQPDIFIEPNICIFADGDYWHANPNKYKAEDIGFVGGKIAQQLWDKDKKVTDALTHKGYKVLRFWEHDIHKNIEYCTSEIKNALIPDVSSVEFSTLI